jgi:hypothetical protein
MLAHVAFVALSVVGILTSGIITATFWWQYGVAKFLQETKIHFTKSANLCEAITIRRFYSTIFMGMVIPYIQRGLPYTLSPFTLSPVTLSPGHFVPWSLCPRSLCPRSLCPLVTLSPGHFVLQSLCLQLLCPPVILSPGHFVPGHFVPGHFVPGHFVSGHFVPGHFVLYFLFLE